ncbi:MAG: hypothetical protein FWG25_03835 [Promicromonosporaceae bacterium]|nr:hypothetical protein [Promicromonosporaceae bacterium]
MSTEPLRVRRRRKNRRNAAIAAAIVAVGIIAFLVMFPFTYRQALLRSGFGQEWLTVWNGRDFNGDQFVVAISRASPGTCAFGAIVTNRGWRGWQLDRGVMQSAQSGRLEVFWSQDPTIDPLGWINHLMLYGTDAIADFHDLRNVLPPEVTYSVSQTESEYFIHLIAPLSEMPDRPFQLLEEAGLIRTWEGPNLVCQQ